MFLLFNMLSRLVITFHQMSKRLNFMATIMICSNSGDTKNKVSHCFHCFPIYLPWKYGTRCHDLVFWMLSFKPTFPFSSFTFIKRLFSSSSLFAKGWYHLHIWVYWFFSWQTWFQLVLPAAQRFSWCTLQRRYISKVTIYSLGVLLFLFGTSLLFNAQF